MNNPRGLAPDTDAFSFELDEDTAKPVDLDDYFDEPQVLQHPSAPRAKRPLVETVRRNVVEPKPAERPAPTLAKEDGETRAGEKPSKRRPPRKELSLDPDSKRKASDMVEDIREQGPEDNASGSEYVRALVHLSHDARHKADYSHLNQRGQWGSPTAKAFVADLKESFLRAIGALYVERYPHLAAQQLSKATLTDEPVPFENDAAGPAVNS